ncbi:MAG: hypothetical protein H6621_00415 [Halobacteriovoraceae bacterium]|nr:hypothetical protein [Halobacteriovoraceae bacterium]
MKYKNGRNISKNVINAIRFVGKVGSMERDTWYELFSHGTLRWRQMQLQGLIAKKIFKYHTSRHGHNALVIDSFGTKLIKEQGWQHVHTVYPHEIEHDVTVAAGVWKLEERGICEKWMTEREMKSQNSPHFKINLSGGESKYPDIVLRHKVEDSKFISAIEYEKTAKSNWRYNKMISAYSESTDFDSILFIVENYGIERSIKRSMKYIRDSYLNSKIDFVSKDVWIEAPHLVNINKLASKI